MEKTVVHLGVCGENFDDVLGEQAEKYRLEQLEKKRKIALFLLENFELTKHIVK